MKIILPSSLQSAIDAHGDKSSMEPIMKPITTPLIALPGVAPMEGQISWEEACEELDAMDMSVIDDEFYD